LVTDVFGFTDVLISFRRQKIKGQGHGRRTTLSEPPRQMKAISPNSVHAFVFVDMLIRFWDQKSNVKITTDNDQKH